MASKWKSTITREHAKAGEAEATIWAERASSDERPKQRERAILAERPKQRERALGYRGDSGMSDKQPSNVDTQEG